MTPEPVLWETQPALTLASEARQAGVWGGLERTLPFEDF